MLAALVGQGDIPRGLSKNLSLMSYAADLGVVEARLHFVINFILRKPVRRGLFGRAIRLAVFQRELSETNGRSWRACWRRWRGTIMQGGGTRRLPCREPRCRLDVVVFSFSRSFCFYSTGTLADVCLMTETRRAESAPQLVLVRNCAAVFRATLDYPSRPSRKPTSPGVIKFAVAAVASASAVVERVAKVEGKTLEFMKNPDVNKNPDVKFFMN